MPALLRRPLVLVLLALVAVAAVGGVIWYQATPHTAADCEQAFAKQDYSTDAKIDQASTEYVSCLDRVGG